MIEGFLPRQMDEAEAKAAIAGVVAEIGATSVKDMGRVMAAVKERFAGKLDMSQGERAGEGGAGGVSACLIRLRRAQFEPVEPVEQAAAFDRSSART